MFRIYLTEAIKNIKSNITLSVIIVLLFTFLIQISSYSLAWATYYIWQNDSFGMSAKTESYLEYSIYALKSKGNVPTSPIIRSSGGKIDANGNLVRVELTEEDIAYNEKVVENYEQIYKKLKEIDGLVILNKKWGELIFNDRSAYELSRQNTDGKKEYTEDEYSLRYYGEDLGYSYEEISQFCDYNSVRYSIDTILMENFTYCEGRGWTEEDLQFDYLIKEDGTLPTTPIVMGYDFRDYYDVGDIISNPEGRRLVKKFEEGTLNPESSVQHYGHFQVIGFLEKDTAVESQSGGLRKSLDNYIVIPEVPNTPEYYPNELKTTQANDFYHDLLKSLIYIEKDNEAQIVEELSKVLSEDPVRGMYYSPEKFSQANAVYEQMYENRMINFALISGSTLIFSFAVIILIIVNKFNSNIKDTAIHRLVGATVSDGVKAYIFEFAIYLLCADILSHYVYIIYAFDRTSTVLSGFWMSIMIGGVRVRMMYPLMIAIDILFLAIVAIVAYICSAKLDTATIIKGKE